MSLSVKDAERFAKELYRPLLPKLGCNRNFPLCLRYNPSYLIGLDLYDPYIEHGIALLQIFVTHASTSSITGKLLNQLLEQHQLEVGMFESLFSLPFYPYSHLIPDSFIKELWEFLCKYKFNYSLVPSFYHVPPG